MALALPFALALFLSAALVPFCRAVALRLGYVAPAVRQSGKPKTLFGGVAVALTLFAATAAIGAFEALPILVLCSAGLFVVGFATDLFALKPATKLVAVIAVASVFLVFDARLYWSQSNTFDTILTLFWIVAITSSFALLDNMDGLCAGTAVIAGTAFLITMLPLEESGPLLLRMQYLAVLLGALVGFLIYNVHPASVVMGSSGSLVVGLNMAAMTLQLAPGRGSNLLSIVAVPVVVLLIPVVDGALVALSRLVSGRGSPAAASGASRLVAFGLSERKAVALLWLVAAFSGLVAVIADRTESLSGLMAGMFTIGMTLFAVHLARMKIHDGVAPDALTGTIVPLDVELGYRHRMFEVLLDLCSVAIAYYGAFRLRFDVAEWAENFVYFRQSFPVVLGVQIVALFASGAYRGTWRYFSLSDSVTFAKAVFVGVVTSQVAVLYLYRFEGYSPGIFIVYAMMLFLLLNGSRASFRLVSEFIQRQRHAGKRLVIYGADAGGFIAVRHLLADVGTAYRIIGFVDDDVRKRNVRVQGYRVIGGYDHLVGLIMAGEVDAIALTHDATSASGLQALCEKHGVTLYRVALDWRELGASRAAAASAASSRVVAFTGVRRESSAPDARLSEAVASATAAVVDEEAARRPIKVVHIITRLILGGAQENTLYTAIGQHRDARFDVTLLCGVDEAGEGNMFGEATRAGVRTVVLPSLVREIRPLTDLNAVVDVYRFLRRGGYDVVHTHSSKAGIIGRVAARLAGVRVVVHTQHGLAFHDYQARWKNALYIALERLCAPFTHRIISVSDLIGQAAVARRIGRADQHVTIYSGLELDLFLSAGDHVRVEEAKRAAGIPPEAPVVGKIARLFPLKGHEQFLAVAAEISRRMPGVYFLLVGDGPLRDEVRAEAERLGFGDRLVMTGRVSPTAVPQYIQAMDVVVHTSLREGIARVLPQAGAVGKPVVTFRLDGAPEVVRDGVSGFLVPPLDVTRIAERTIELLRDAAMRQAFGAAGRAFVRQHFAVDQMVARINELYLDALSTGK